MIRLTFALAVILTSSFTVSQQPGALEKYYVLSEPGNLETAILSGLVPAQRQELGSLTPPGTAIFYAVIVGPDSNGKAAKGLELRLEGDDPFNNNKHCKDTVYVDEEGLAALQKHLEEAAKSQEHIAAHLSEYNPKQLERPSITMAANRSPGKVDYYVPVEFGHYRRDGAFGVYIMAPPSQNPAHRHSTAQFLMPKADIREVLKVVREGRSWLALHSLSEAAAKTPSSEAEVH